MPSMPPPMPPLPGAPDSEKARYRLERAIWEETRIAEMRMLITVGLAAAGGVGGFLLYGYFVWQHVRELVHVMAGVVLILIAAHWAVKKWIF